MLRNFGLFLLKLVEIVIHGQTAKNAGFTSLEPLEESEEENESKEVNSIEDKLSWCVSEPEVDALSDSDSEITVSDSEFYGKMILQKF